MVGKVAWHQNDNGETVLDQPDPGLATHDVYGTVVTAIQTPVVGYLLASLNATTSGTKEYVDRATWRIVRREYVRANGTTTHVYDEFRTTAGVTEAWHWTVRDGHPEKRTGRSALRNPEAPPVRRANARIDGYAYDRLDYGRSMHAAALGAGGPRPHADAHSHDRVDRTRASEALP